MLLAIGIITAILGALNIADLLIERGLYKGASDQAREQGSMIIDVVGIAISFITAAAIFAGFCLALSSRRSDNISYDQIR